MEHETSMPIINCESMKEESFYNPHLLGKTNDRMELQKRFFHRLLKAASCYQVNTGVGSLDEVKKKVMEAVEK